MRRYAQRLLASRPFRFMVSGGLAALVEYLSFVLIVSLLGIYFVMLGQTVSYLFGFVISFYLQRNWVYRSKGSVKRELLKYTLLAAINVVLSALALWLLIDRLSASPFVAKIIVMAMVAAWNYLIFQRFIFVTQKH